MQSKQFPFIVDIPAEEYHAAARRGEFLSSHLLGDFRSCPLLYKKKLSGEIEPGDSTAYAQGRAIHTLILEGREQFDREYMISGGPINPKSGEPFGKTTKSYREWAAAQKRPVISPEDFGWMMNLQRSVWKHPLAGELIMNGRPEGTIRTRYNGEPVQIRMDYFREDYEGVPAIIDLKTCDNLTFFERDAIKYGYPAQLAFYRRVFEIACAENPSHVCEGAAPRRPLVYIVAVEKREPYRCGVWLLTDELLEKERIYNEKAMELLKECRARAEWPTGFELMRTMDVQ